MIFETLCRRRECFELERSLQLLDLMCAEFGVLADERVQAGFMHMQGQRMTIRCVQITTGKGGRSAGANMTMK